MVKHVDITYRGLKYPLTFKFCAPGTYRIFNRPKHAMHNATVVHSEGYWLQEITVSLGLYQFVYGEPYYDYPFSDEESKLMPWEGIGFKKIVDFLNRINEILILNKYTFSFDLPTVTEWEHGLLCGADHLWSWGDNGEELKDYAWFKDNSNGTLHCSKQKKPNGWGLYDLYGNVHEYCYDVELPAGTNYFENPSKIQPQEGQALPCMGGSFESSTDECASFNVIGFNNDYIQPTGFRLIIRND